MARMSDGVLDFNSMAVVFVFRSLAWYTNSNNMQNSRYLLRWLMPMLPVIQSRLLAFVFFESLPRYLRCRPSAGFIGSSWGEPIEFVPQIWRKLMNVAQGTPNGGGHGSAVIHQTHNC
jgi:hypothetical protein